MISELLDGIRVRTKRLLKWLRRKWQQTTGANVQKLKEERERARLWRETSCSIRRPEAARSNARIQFPRSFNHFECARSLKLFRSLSPAFSRPVQVPSWLLAGSRFVILANNVPFFQQPVFSSMIQPHPQKSSSTPHSRPSPLCNLL